jgi:hypothetical protein
MDRELHQRLIDGLSVWVLQGQITKDRALEIERNVTRALPQGSNEVAEAILWQVGKDEGIDD